jgi:hypothetical protein
MKPHLITSLVNSGIVTVFTSLAMTYRNSHLELAIWLPNWLISWVIVCAYVYYFAPVVHRNVYEQRFL